MESSETRDQRHQKSKTSIGTYGPRVGPKVGYIVGDRVGLNVGLSEGETEGDTVLEEENNQ